MSTWPVFYNYMVAQPHYYIISGEPSLFPLSLTLTLSINRSHGMLRRVCSFSAPVHTGTWHTGHLANETWTLHCSLKQALNWTPPSSPDNTLSCTQLLHIMNEISIYRAHTPLAPTQASLPGWMCTVSQQHSGSSHLWSHMLSMKWLAHAWVG